MENLKKTLSFLELTIQFRRIERDILFSVEQRKENDTEHSYQLTMIAWYIATLEKLDLNLNKIIKYSLIHDLVEVYAGDTPLYTKDLDYLKSKKERELKSAQVFKMRFKDFPELHELIDKYLHHKDKESQFVFMVDKLLPVLAIYLDKGHAWRTHGITPDLIIEKNQANMTTPQMRKYFDSMIKLIKNKPEYFI